MKVIYKGSGCKTSGQKYKNNEVCDMPNELAIEFIKRAGFELYVEEVKERNFGLEQNAFIEKAIKNIKKEGK